MQYAEAGKEWSQLNVKPNTDVTVFNLDLRESIEVRHANIATNGEISRHVVGPEGQLDVELYPYGTGLFSRISPESDVEMVRLAVSR